MIDEDMIATLQIQADRIAELEKDKARLLTQVNHGTPDDACYSTDDDPNCPLEHLWVSRNGDLKARAEAAEAKVARLREALHNMTERYVDLVNCGDCGFWNPEKEPPVIAARAALKDTQS